MPRLPTEVGNRNNIYLNQRGMALSGSDTGSAFKNNCGMVNEKQHKKELVIDAWNTWHVKTGNRRSKSYITAIWGHNTQQSIVNLLREQKCRISMSGKGNCCDNACMESFFATLKAEMCGRTFETRQSGEITVSHFL